MLVLTALTLTALDYRSTGGSSAFDAVRRGGDAVFGPAQRAFGGLVSAVPRLLRGGDQQAEMQREIDRLRNELLDTEGLRRQLAEQQSLLGLKDSGGYTLKAARVVSVGSSLGFEWTATIDLGSGDGVVEGATVVNGKGLVGRVKRVGPRTSVVLLLVDADVTVGVRLVRSGQLGLVTGRGPAGLTYQLIGERARAEVGDAMFTSGSTFKAGIPVGRVTGTSNNPNSPTLTGTLEPFVDVTTLDLVAVVLDGPRRAPRPAVLPSPQPSPQPSPRPSPGASPP